MSSPLWLALNSLSSFEDQQPLIVGLRKLDRAFANLTKVCDEKVLNFFICDLFNSAHD
jgi:hypothetical protein